jgi:S-formylglutathione hydrolase FrmB
MNGIGRSGDWVIGRLKKSPPGLPGSRKYGFLLLWILVFLGIAALPAHADGRVECATVKSRILGHPVRYCALLPDSYDADKTHRYPILYYLHGLGDNQSSLVNSGGWNMIENLRETGKIGDFLIVTPDGGDTFYINSHDGKVRYEDFFIREFIPAIETRYRVERTRASRGISGTSMGGYGALRFAFKYPELFSSVSVHSAALYKKIPQRIVAAANDHAEDLDMGGVFGMPIDQQFWIRNTPFTLARLNAARLKRMNIYFDCGDQDDYGFDQGARQLDALLTSLRVPHEFHIYPGGHDWMYVAQHFPESLEFQSRALKQ